MSDEQKPKIEVFESSGARFVHLDGKMHSIDDAPAVVCPDGTKWWYQNGVIHRDAGPAVVWHNGTQEWFQNNQRHRTGGPAVIFSDDSRIVPELRGVKQYWENGQLIREDLPPNIAAYRAELVALKRKHGLAP